MLGWSRNYIRTEPHGIKPMMVSPKTESITQII